MNFKVFIRNGGALIEDAEGNRTAVQNEGNIIGSNHPITVRLKENINFKKYNNKDYLVKIITKKEATLNLIEKLKIRPLGDKSDILLLSIEDENPLLSEKILNKLIETFNYDGILDKQLVSKRTLDFIDDRFTFLSKELDSIEVEKTTYKQSNSLSYIEADATSTIEKKTISESEVFELETQLELSKILKNALRTTKYSFKLLPADIGVENSNINSLVREYNENVLKRKKLVVSAGKNNPSVLLLSSELNNYKENILNTVNNYQKQIRTSLKQLNKQNRNISDSFSKLPEKEKILRAIERQQLIKENLFILLLQKREEAAISFAVTAPSIKVVDYALTKLSPIFPKKILILAAFLFLGLLIPLAFFFIKYTFDSKIKDKLELEKIIGNIPLLAEIPKLADSNKFIEKNERSIKAESFRILCSSINYILPKKDNNTGNVIYVTSAIKGEGKTLMAINLAMAYASINKKVLLIGADLRNPRLHTFFNINKNKTGFSNYLVNPSENWEEYIDKKISNETNVDICFSGPIPPNAPQLLASENLDKFINEAKAKYDYIIFDTSPTMPVSDTLLISKYADATIFVCRTNYTEKNIINFSKNLNDTGKLNNMAYILNDVVFDKRKSYNYEYNFDEEKDYKKNILDIFKKKKEEL